MAGLLGIGVAGEGLEEYQISLTEDGTTLMLEVLAPHLISLNFEVASIDVLKNFANYIASGDKSIFMKDVEAT